MKFKESKTRENLARSFAGECQEGARYQWLAKLAKAEQQYELETLMKGIATNEMAHAKIFWDHLVNLEGQKNFNIPINAGFPFNENTLGSGLKFASENEFSEHKNIYPSFAAIARDEGFPEVEKSFLMISEIENCHYMMTEELYQKYTKNALLKSKEANKWKCTNCGYEKTAKAAWNECPNCGVGFGYVMIPLSD